MLEETQDEQEIIARVAALDIGKAELVCCVRIPDPGGGSRRVQEVTTYSTMTRSLQVMADRLMDLGVTRIVMEATSDYWKLPFYLLEAHGFDVWLVNARDVKNLPGRPKTDRLDAVWLCKVLPDGTYLSVLINPKIRAAARRERIMAAATDGQDLDPQEAHLVRVVEYDVPDRTGNGTGELIVLLSTITDPHDASAAELADSYHQRWEQESANNQIKTNLRGPGKVLRSRLPDPGPPGDLGLADRSLCDRRPDQSSGGSS